MPDLEENVYVNCLQLLPILEDRLRSIKEATKADKELQKLLQEDIHVEDGILLRANRVIVPGSLRSTLIRLLHAAHAGKEKMKARAREILFWPGMKADIENTYDSCVQCQEYGPRHTKMPTLSHDVPALPWQRVGMYLSTYDGQQYVVMVDYYSFYFEVQKLKKTAATSIVNFCMRTLATHGLPITLVTDNGPPFSSKEFDDILRRMQVRHIT
ncbi:uncharacterized protein K02A2.6-like [Ornithodoros turicata]|uniref:uncharacterized protein K02A2.6-like n=1 Tax=Ornithodoros turicata TaxID=34597 RepID=UPI0031395C64